jgi:hypothetical protein
VLIEGNAKIYKQIKIWALIYLARQVFKGLMAALTGGGELLIALLVI